MNKKRIAQLFIAVLLFALGAGPKILEILSGSNKSLSVRGCVLSILGLLLAFQYIISIVLRLCSHRCPGAALWIKQHKTLKSAFIVFFMAALTLASLEACAHCYIKQYYKLSVIDSAMREHFLYSSHPIIGYWLTPGFNKKKYHFLNSYGLMAINSRGYRGDPITPKTHNTVRIVCFGGSTTMSLRVKNDKTYPSVMEKLLQSQYPDLDIDVVNAGVGGYTSSESLRTLTHRALDLEPDAIMIYQAVNDIHPRVAPGFKNDYSHYRKPMTKLPEPLFPKFLLKNFNLFRLIRFTQLLSYQDIVALTTKPGARHPELINQKENFAKTTSYAYRRNIESMICLAQKRGMEVILCTFFYSPENLRASLVADYETYKQGFAEHNSVMRELAKKYGCLLIDLAAKFPGQQTDLFSGYVHLYEEGNHIKSEICSQDIIASGLIPQIINKRKLK